MRSSEGRSDVCSYELQAVGIMVVGVQRLGHQVIHVPVDGDHHLYFQRLGRKVSSEAERDDFTREFHDKWVDLALNGFNDDDILARESMQAFRSEEHTSELQSLMRISYSVFCLKIKKKHTQQLHLNHQTHQDTIA